MLAPLRPQNRGSNLESFLARAEGSRAVGSWSLQNSVLNAFLISVRMVFMAMLDGLACLIVLHGLPKVAGVQRNPRIVGRVARQSGPLSSRLRVLRVSGGMVCLPGDSSGGAPWNCMCGVPWGSSIRRPLLSRRSGGVGVCSDILV